MKKYLSVALVVCGMILAVSANSIAASVLSGTLPTGGIVLADTTKTAVSNSFGFTGNAQEQVYRTSGGTLDFFIQAQVTSAGGDLNSLVAGLFVPASVTGVYYDTSDFLFGAASSNHPDTWNNSAGPLNLTMAGGGNILPGPGETSLLIVTTSYTSYVPGYLSLQDNGSMQMAAYGDLAGTTVPEPMSLLLLGAGLVGLVGVGRKFKK